MRKRIISAFLVVALLFGTVTNYNQFFTLRTYAAVSNSELVDSDGNVKSNALVKAINEQKSSSSKTISVTVKNAKAVSADTLKKAASAAGKIKKNCTLYADTLNSNGKIETRIYIDVNKAAKAGKELSLAASVTNPKNESLNSIQQVFNSTKGQIPAIISLSQQSNFSVKTKISAKIDLSKLNKDSLEFYTYDKTSKKYGKLSNVDYNVDKNGYLTFSTTRGKDILIFGSELKNSVKKATFNLKTSGLGTVTSSVKNGKYAEGAVITISANGKSGYTFSKWESNGGGVLSSSTAKTTTLKMTDKDASITAVFTKKVSSASGSGAVAPSVIGGVSSSTSTASTTKHTVSFNFNYDNIVGTIPNQAVEKYSYASKPVDPVRTGYKFDGWYKDSACTNAFSFNSDTITSNITLYAKWSLAYNTVIFNLNCADAVGVPSNQYLINNSLVTEPAKPTRDGYTFAGWYIDSNCTNEFNFAEEKIMSDITLYAKWEVILINLSANKNTVLVGSGSNEVLFYAQTDLQAESIQLYEQSGLITEMFDDGNLSSHGDDMAGDGIYSAKYSAVATEDTVLLFNVQAGSEQSNVVDVKVYLPISEETLVVMENVDTAIDEIINAESYENLTEEKKQELVEKELEELAENELIVEDSICYSEEAGIYSFQYNGGIQGGVMIKEFDDDYNGVEQLTETDEDTDLSENTEYSVGDLSEEEKYKLWEERENAEKVSVNTFSLPITPFGGMELPEADDVGTAIILNSFPAFEKETDKIEFRTSFYVAIESLWDSMGLETDLDTDVTVEDYKNLSGYDIICISTHGSTYEWNDGFLWLNSHRLPAICLAEKSSKEKDEKYSAELKDKQIVKVNGYYWLLPSFIENAYTNSDLDGSIIFSEACQYKGKDGIVDNSMSNAFETRSAETVVGFHNSVYAVYSREFMQSFVYSLIQGEETKTAFDTAVIYHGANHKIWLENQGKKYDDKLPVAYPILSGRTDATLFQTGLLNGLFNSLTDMIYGYPGSWNKIGDVRSVSQLGEIETIGENNLRMAIITTGIGSKTTVSIEDGTEGSMMSQRFIVPTGTSKISFDYNFVSEEPMEFVGSKYDDSFVVQIKQGGNTAFENKYESINTSTWIEVEGINFAGGDDTVYHTGWKNVTIDVSQYAGKMINLCFIVFDKGDSIYDSACLIDNVVLA